MTFYPHLGWKQNSYKLIILSYSNFLEFVLVFNVLQERNYGIYYQIKKKILNFAYLNRLRRQFSLYRCSLPFHDGILICHDHEMCRVLEHEIKSEAIFTFTFGFVWYKHQSIWFYDVSYMVYLMKRFSIFCKLWFFYCWSKCLKYSEITTI